MPEKRRLPFMPAVAIFVLVPVSASLLLTMVSRRQAVVVDSKRLEATSWIDLVPKGRILSGRAESNRQIIVFSDPRCAICATDVPEVMAYLENSDTCLRLRYLFPKEDKVAFQAAIIGEIGDELGRLPRYERACATILPGNVAALKNLCAEMGISTDMADTIPSAQMERYIAHIEQDFKLARKLRLSGTPVFILCERGKLPVYIQPQDAWRYK
jgi:hypothetical protein